jgi:hypothetical protein
MKEINIVTTILKNDVKFNDLVYVGDKIIMKDTLVLELNGLMKETPTKTSIQLDNNEHIEDKYGKYMNHSCNPTCYIKERNVYSLGKLTKGMSITFNYNGNENKLASPFNCVCCNRVIRGKNV